MGEQDQAVTAKWSGELRRLGDQLLSQAEAGNWGRVQQLDVLIAKALQQLRQQSALKSQLDAPLQQLQQQHRLAHALCRQAQGELGAEMARFNARREGIRAYEESQTWC